MRKSLATEHRRAHTKRALTVTSEQASPLNLHDYERLARERLNRAVWDTYAQGSEDEQTLRANRDAYSAVRLRPRVLVDATTCDTSTTVLGIPVRLPVLIAPTSVHQLAHPQAELATARAASTSGTLMIASTLSSRSLEDIAGAAADAPLWFQLYLFHDERLNLRLLERAEQAGYRAIVLTVDAQQIGNRERDRRNGFNLPPGVRLGNFATPADDSNEHGTSFQRVTWDTRGERPGLTWDVIAWLRERTTLPLILKGILTGEDARRATEAGVDAIIVSNHGGRQLDGAVSTLEVLPEVVDAAGAHCEVYMDGGIRRGTDVLKALALGARATLIGRPVFWGLAVSGEAGVQDVFAILREELALSMRLAGLTAIASIDRSAVKISCWGANPLDETQGMR